MPNVWATWERANNAVKPAGQIHECRVPVRVRIVWHRAGEQVVEAVATGWAGGAVRVELSDPVVILWVGGGCGAGLIWGVSGRVRSLWDAWGRTHNASQWISGV